MQKEITIHKIQPSKDSTTTIITNSRGVYIKYVPILAIDNDITVNTLELINDVRKLGKSIFLKLYDNNIPVITPTADYFVPEQTKIKHNDLYINNKLVYKGSEDYVSFSYDTYTSVNPDVFLKSNYYTSDLEEFINKYGIPLYDIDRYKKIKWCIEKTNSQFDFNPDVFLKSNYYTSDLEKFINKYGIPLYDIDRYEKIQWCIEEANYSFGFNKNDGSVYLYDDLNPNIQNDESVYLYDDLNPIIQAAIIIFLVLTIKNETDRITISKIYENFEVRKDDKNTMFCILRSLLTGYDSEDRSISFQIRTTSIENSIWNEFYNLIFDNNYNAEICCYCGNYITDDDSFNYKDIHRHCLEEYKGIQIKKLKKRIDNTTDTKKIVQLEKEINKYNDKNISLGNDCTDGQEYAYSKFKKSMKDSKYNEKRKKNSKISQ